MSADGHPPLTEGGGAGGVGEAPLKVLLVSLFHPELVRGGAQQICYEIFEGLKDRSGVDAKLLAVVDPSFTSFYKLGACITGFDGRDGEFLFLSRDYDYWWQRSSDVRTKEAFADFLRQVRPDVVHFHHFLLLGLDILTLTRKVLPEVKIVLTFHEFVAICHADGHMVRRTDGSLCAGASQVRCHQCFPDYRPEDFFAKKLWTEAHLSVVDRFTVPSRFMIDTYVKWGIERSAIVCVANAQRKAAGTHLAVSAPGRRNRFGFFGQFVDVKGVRILLEAVAILRAEGFDQFVVELNGDNIRYASEEGRAAIEDFLAAENLLPPSERRVRNNGSYEAAQIGERMHRIDWCVVPSVWPEAFCLVISEAWMFARPVIASDAGAPAERIRHEGDGLLFPLGDARALAATMRRAATEEGLWDRLSDAIADQPERAAMVEAYLDVYDRIDGLVT